MIFYTFALWEAESENIGHRKWLQTNLRNDFLEIMKLLFFALKLFLAVFHFLFGNEQILKRTTQGTFLQKISPLGVVVSERFKKKLPRTRTRGHDIRSE
jgi:hypothetical protein